jgi:hypothetical protein
MSYRVQHANAALGGITVFDNTLDQTTSLPLIGKTYSNYGGIIDQNFLSLLENFSDVTAPANPVKGQLWFDLTNKRLQVYVGKSSNTDTGWKTVGGGSSMQPENPSTGDLWLDETNAANIVLKAWTGSYWLTIGPSAAQGSVTGEVLRDVNGRSWNVLSFSIGNVRYAILNPNISFIPSPGINGFERIEPGINLVNQSFVAGMSFVGQAKSALALRGSSENDLLYANSFIRANVNVLTTGTLSFRNNLGIYVGSADNAQLSVTNNDFSITNRTANAKTFLKTTASNGVTLPVLELYANLNAQFDNDVNVVGSLTANRFSTHQMTLDGAYPSLDPQSGTLILSAGGLGVAGNINAGGTTHHFYGTFIGNTATFIDTVNSGGHSNGSITLTNSTGVKVGNLAVGLGTGTTDQVGLYNTTGTGGITLGTSGANTLRLDVAGNVFASGSVTAGQLRLSGAGALKIGDGAFHQVLISDGQGNTSWEYVSQIIGGGGAGGSFDYLFPRGDWNGTEFDYATLGPVEAANNHYDMQATPPYRIYLVDLNN